MAISRPGYTSREVVKVALELTSSTDDFAVDLAIAQASEKIDGQLRRVFYPTYDTRYFDYPNDQLAESGELWLEGDELVDVTTFNSGGQVIPPASYLLYPNVPYNRVVMDRAVNASFTSGATYQKSIAITGTFGYTNSEVLATTLVSNIDASQTLVTVTNSASVGVGQLIRVGVERMLIVGKRLIDSGQHLLVSMENTPSQNAVSVTDSSTFNVGETIQIGAEPMVIISIAGNVLYVKRSSTEMESHLVNSTIYVPRQLELIRASTGTTAASASTSAGVYLLTPPHTIQQLCLAEAVTTYLQSTTGYARSLGSGSSDGKPAGAGLTELWNAANATFKRYLTGAV